MHGPALLLAQTRSRGGCLRRWARLSSRTVAQKPRALRAIAVCKVTPAGPTLPTLDAPPLYVATRPDVLASLRAPGARPTPAAPDVGARRLRSPCLIRDHFASCA